MLISFFTKTSSIFTLSALTKKIKLVWLDKNVYC